MRKILLLLLFPTIVLAQFPTRTKVQSIATDSIRSNSAGSVILDDTLAISGYAQVNNIEAKSGDMVAIRDTLRTTLTAGIGSLTRTIDSALTVFLPGSATEYGGIHARGLLLSGNISTPGTITSGLINGQTISSAANFTGTVDIAGTAPFFVEALGVTGEILIDYSTTAGPSNGLRVELDHPTGAASGSPSLRGIYNTVSNNNTSGTFSSLTGILNTLNVGVGGGITTNARGVDIVTNQDGTGTDLYGFYLTNSSIGGTLTNYYQMWLGSPSVSGTLSNSYGIYQESGSGANVFGGSSNTFSALTASRLTATDASKNLVSTITLANLASSVSDVTGTTGTGNLVLSASPTFTETVAGTALDFTGAGTFGGILNLIGQQAPNPSIRFQSVSAPASNIWDIRIRDVVEGDFQIYDVVNSATRLYIDASGNVTIPSGSLSVTGAGTFGGTVAVNGGDLTSTATTFNLLNATVTTLNLGGAATTVMGKIKIGGSTLAQIDSAKISGDTLKFYVGGTAYNAVKGSSLWGIALILLIGAFCNRALSQTVWTENPRTKSDSVKALKICEKRGHIVLFWNDVISPVFSKHVEDFKDSTVVIINRTTKVEEGKCSRCLLVLRREDGLRELLRQTVWVDSTKVRIRKKK